MATVVVNTHGHCFDGAASATLFTALLTALRPDEKLSFQYRSCGYGPRMSQVPVEWLSGDVNAILDFRYTEADRLSWFFDHHRTGFASQAEERAAFERAPRAGRKIHFDADYGSCALLIRDVAERDYGVSLERHAELVRWANTIDTAGFESARAALADTPAQRLAMVIEQHGDTAFLAELVPRLLAESMDDLAASSLVQGRLAPILEARAEFERRVAAAAKVEGDVVVVDLADKQTGAAGKFVTYALFPTEMYSVLVLRTAQLVKLSVGYNPWCGRPRTHDISALMKREGGGGHAVVGAAAFPLSDLARARAAAERVTRALSLSPPGPAGPAAPADAGA